MENIVYFDNAATTFPKPECVYTAMDQFARICGVSIGRGQHSLSSKAAYIADETRELLQELFHACNKKVVFTNTATEALNIIIRIIISNIYGKEFLCLTLQFTRYTNHTISFMNHLNIRKDKSQITN